MFCIFDMSYVVICLGVSLNVGYRQLAIRTYT